MEWKPEDLFDLSHTLAAPLLMRCGAPWEALTELGTYLADLGKELDPGRFEQRAEQVWIARTAVIAPNVTICGPCIIGEKTELRPGAYLRGNVLVGDGCVVGNSTELKNCVLSDGVQVPHYNYVGDSILGYRAHLGAGAITSNVKSDKSEVVIRRGGTAWRTGRKKCGALVGDGAEVGCNSVLCPGTVLGRGSTVYPLSCVRGYVDENCIFKSSDRIVKKNASQR